MVQNPMKRYHHITGCLPFTIHISNYIASCWQFCLGHNLDLLEESNIKPLPIVLKWWDFFANFPAGKINKSHQITSRTQPRWSSRTLNKPSKPFGWSLPIFSKALAFSNIRGASKLVMLPQEIDSFIARWMVKFSWDILQKKSMISSGPTSIHFRPSPENQGTPQFSSIFWTDFPLPTWIRMYAISMVSHGHQQKPQFCERIPYDWILWVINLLFLGTPGWLISKSHLQHNEFQGQVPSTTVTEGPRSFSSSSTLVFHRFHIISPTMA